jgi:hypothetical protein
MIPAVRWEDQHVEGWTVMGHVGQRREYLRNCAVQARRRLDRLERRDNAPAAALQAAARDEILASWQGSLELLALLFAHPDSATFQALMRRKDYFDIRTGEIWSLLFPGYYQTGESRAVRQDPFIGQPRETGDWDFDPEGFNDIRSRVTEHSARRWRYSGETDLVLIGVWMPEDGAIVIDWGSTVSGRIPSDEPASPTRSLGAVIETITNSFDEGLEPRAEVASLLSKDERPSVMRAFTTEALANVTAALAAYGLGIT